MPAGIVTGLADEARIVRQVLGSSFWLDCAGASAAGARDSALRLAEAGAEGLLSFGVAGGLEPALQPGDLILAETVVGPGGERLAADPAWRSRVLAAASARSLRAGGLAGSNDPVTTAEAKARLHRETAALAVDMESHAVALVAAERGLPFLALRAVADPADRAVPRAAMAAIGPDGHSRLGPVLLGLARRPWELPALLALKWDFRQALEALEREARALREPLFGGP